MKKTTLLGITLLLLMGIKAQAQQCDTISTFPWEADFNDNFSCWAQSGSGGIWYVSNSQAIWGELYSGGTTPRYINIATPHVRLDSASTTMCLWWKDQRNYMYPNLRVVVLKADNSRDTLYTADMPSVLTQHSVSLAAYAGQTIRIAFEVRLSGTGYSYRATLRDIVIGSQYAPMGTLSVPNITRVGDSVTAVVNLTRGQAPISYTWHSTMLGNRAGSNTLHLVYPTSGVDTITVTASNAYGSLTRTALVHVHNCQTVTELPWREDFVGQDTAYYNICWQMSGWQNMASRSFADENGATSTYTHLMYASGNGKYMLSPAISIPTTGLERLRLWVQSNRRPAIRISTTASLDTADYTDTICVGANTNNMIWHLFDLSPYAGQTIRVGLFKENSSTLYVNCVRVDYDTMPVLWQVTIPDRSRTDSTITCSAGLLRGDTVDLTYTWHSSLMDTTWVDNTTASLSTFNLTYTIGGLDTITVIASNNYGSDTMMRTVEVADCYPALTLPWIEDFSYGISCWYTTQNNTTNQWQSNYSGSGSNRNWLASSSSNYAYTYTPADAWLVSKAVTIPADTALHVRLFWHVGLSYHNNVANRYSIMVSTDADRTDTSSYAELYCDTSLLPYVNNGLAQRSASLADYAGQTIYIAFRNQPLVTSYSSLLIDDVEVRTTVAPRVSLTADDENYYYHDTATFVATLEEGVTTGLTYTWHSSLLDSTVAAGDTLRLCYGMTDGWDTVTVVATNTYGSDTALVVVRSQIITQPYGTITHNAAFVGDTTLFEANLGFFIRDGLTLQWHSTLMGTTVNDSTMALIYPTSGTDTVTLVISTLFGVDTVTVTVDVSSHPLPQITLSAPTVVGINDTAALGISLNDCSRNDLTCSIHSSLHGSTWALGLSPDSSLVWPLVCSLSGIDTVSIIVTNLYGADTANTVIEVFNCGGVMPVPYTEDFESVAATASTVAGSLPTCWEYNWNGSNAAYAPHVITTGGYQWLSDIPNNALFMIAGNSTGYDSQAEVILPHFADSLNHLSLAFSYRFEYVNNGTLVVGYYDDTVFTPVDTLAGHSNSYRRDTVSFADHNIAGNPKITIRWIYASSWYAVAIDNIEVYSDFTPHANIIGPSAVNVYDTAHFTANMFLGDTTGLAYTWHSSLTGQSATGNQMTIVYTTDGVDTISLTATNINGSQTVTKIVTVTGAPQVAIAGPIAVDTYDTLVYTSTLVAGTSAGLTYTWHSTLMDTTWVTGSSNTLSFSYTTPGTDQLTCTATNAFGTHTSTLSVSVTYVPLPGSPVVSLQGYAYATCTLRRSSGATSPPRAICCPPPRLKSA